MSRKSNSSLRAGIFVLVGLATVGATVFIIGQQSSLFASKGTLRVRFPDASGLVVGAPVRLAGVDVGTVSGISLSDDAGSLDTVVTLAVEDRFMPRIRTDSFAFIDSKGLLGDKVVNISMGGAQATPLEDGALIPTRQTYSFEGLARSLDDTLGSIGSAARSAEQTVGGLASDQLRTDLHSAAGSLAAILRAVQEGDGVAHDLLYDRELAASTRGAIAELSAATAELRAITREVRSGKGTVHALIYGQDGAAALANLRQASEDLRQASAGVAETVDKVKTGPGLVHALVYDPRGAELVKNLGLLGDRLDTMSEHVAQGRGTVGGLMMDPTVYEDLKGLVGNIERNQLFKQLIRMSIKEGEPRRVGNTP